MVHEAVAVAALAILKLRAGIYLVLHDSPDVLSLLIVDNPYRHAARREAARRSPHEMKRLPNDPLETT